MKNIIIIGFLILSPILSHGQKYDSLKTQILSEVVVEGLRNNGDTLQNFYRSNASSTTETILSRMKGVSLIRRGAYGQEPVVRGLSNGQLNVTIDGMKIFGACTDKMDPVTIYVEPWNLSSVQVMPGPQGSQFGSTIGGALNMKLAQPLVGRPGISATGGMDFQSSARSMNYFSLLNVSRSSSAYRANVTYRKSHNYHAGGGEEILYSQYEKINLAASGKWVAGKNDTIHADVLFDKGWNIGFPALPMDVGEATAGIYSLTYQNVAYGHLFPNVTTKVYYNAVKHSMDDTHRKDVAIHMDMPGKSQTSGVYIESDVHIFHDHKTHMKVEYFTTSSLGEMTMYPPEGAPMYMQTAPDTKRQSAGIFIQQQLKFDYRNKALFSARADHFSDLLQDGIGLRQWQIFNPAISKNSTHFLKTFSVTYTLNFKTNFMLEFQGGYGERMSTLNERFGFYLFNRFDAYDYLGNPELKNERSWNTEINLNFFTPKIELQITPFFQRIDNYIIGKVEPALSPMTIGAKGVKQNINLKHANLSGLDVMVLATPIPSLQWITTLKYTYGVDSEEDALPLIAPLKSVMSCRYEIRKWNIQGECEWSAPQNHVNHSAGEQATDAYAILNVRVGFKINPAWQVNNGIENILDTRYHEHLDWGGVPRPGRNIYLNVIYKLTNK
jgi:iron complex outermembrane receptor protein